MLVLKAKHRNKCHEEMWPFARDMVCCTKEWSNAKEWTMPASIVILDYWTLKRLLFMPLNYK